MSRRNEKTILKYAHLDIQSHARKLGNFVENIKSPS